MRIKETGNDYRYFPEPDIPFVIITDEMIVKAQNEINSGFRVTNTDKVIVKKKSATVTKYTVTYDANGGTGTIDAVQVTAGQSVTLSTGTGLTGPSGKTVFKGWAKTANATSATVTSPFTPDKNITLYAVWATE